MIASIHQPGYLPWHGLFHRVALSDVHVFFDTAQFEKNGFNNRVKIRTAQGDQWLTVPIRTKGRFGKNPIGTAEIDRTVNWRQAHWKTISQAYARGRFFAAHAAFLRDLYAVDWQTLGDLNMHAIQHLASALGVACRFVRASELNATGFKSDLVLSLCQAVGATVYISGLHGRDYLDRAAFDRAGITLRFQCYREPQYRQMHHGFLPYLSVIDLLVNVGPDAREVMMAGQDTVANGTAAT